MRENWNTHTHTYIYTHTLVHMHIIHIWYAFYPVKMQGSGTSGWRWRQQLSLLDLISTGKRFCLLLAGLLIPMSLEVLVLKGGMLLSFDCVDHNKLWKNLQEMGIPDHLTCLLRNLYAGQEATVRTGRGTTDCFQIRKGVRQGCILSPCLLNLYVEHIMRNAGLEEAQGGIKIAGRNISNLRYANDIIFMEGSEQRKSLFMKVKEESEKLA